MKRHLKASLGLGNFNGSGFGARQPTNNHVVREENGAPITTNGNGQSEQSNLDGARGKDADKDDTAERMPRKDTRGESNGREDGILVSADALLDAAHGREPRKSAENGVSEGNANGNREMSAGYGNHRKETVDRFAKMNLGKESDGANSQQSTDVNSLESVKPKDRRGRPPGQHTPAKKPRQGAALRGGESPDEGDGSDEIETAETSSTNFEPLTPEYYPGDLLWSKIGRASFWPCMVIQDPINNKYCEHKNGHFKYYVQYFGHQVVHGWTQNPNRVIPYRGIEAFKEFAAERIAEVKSRQKFYALGPKNQTRQAKENWKQALREIKTAAAYELPQRRYKKFRFAFYPGGKKRTNEASAPPEAEAAPPEPAPEPRLPPQESPESSPNSKPNPPPKVRAKASGKSERDKDVGLEGEDFNNNLGE